MTYIPGTSGEWYSDKRLRKYAPTCALRTINGVRGVGKTTWATAQMYRDWMDGYESVWMRLFKDHMKDSNFYSEFLSGGKRQGFVPEEWVVNSHGVFTDDSLSEKVCHFMDINTGFSKQGNEYFNVRAIYVDEYTVRPGEMYPRNYVGKLASLIGTLGRSRELTVTCMSNWASLSNPIWAAAEVYPGKQDVTAFPEKGIAIEICRNGYYNQDMPDKDSPVGRVLESLGATPMESADEDPNYTLVDPMRPEGSKPSVFVLVTPNGRYRRWEGGAKIYYEKADMKSDDWCFTSDIRWVSREVQLIPASTLNRMRREIEDGKVRFKYLGVLYEVMSAVYSRYA